MTKNNILRRPRRLRATPAIRNLVKQTSLHIDELIYPLFIVEGKGIKQEIASMPDVYRFSLDTLVDEITELQDLGINCVLLFGVLDAHRKDEKATQAYDDNGVVQQAIKTIKNVAPDMCVITDICMCEYTSHGQCGIIDETGNVINDETLPYLSKIALSHAKAGADIVAPSDMMDGRVAHMRTALDQGGYNHVAIMSYSIKYASSFYGPFREAANSAPQLGDRKGYQMDYRNITEALTECELDIQEGADIIMVKPAMAYLDIISKVSQHCNVPIAAYNVSGEYTMLKNAVNQGIVSPDVIIETLTSIKRAGASIIITYFAKDVAKILRGQ